MAHMGKGPDMARTPQGGPMNPITGVHRPVGPAEKAQKPWNVKGNAGLPSGKNGDGDPMTGGSCY